MFMKFARKLRERREQRLISAQLSRMDDRELTDIGIARADIDLVVRRGRMQL